MGHQGEDWEIIGVIKSAMSLRRTPVAVMVSKSKIEGDLSCQFGLFRNGRISFIKHWRENSLHDLAILSKAVAELDLAMTLSGVDMTAEKLEALLERNPHLEYVDAYISRKGKDAGHMRMTLGERVKKR